MVMKCHEAKNVLVSPLPLLTATKPLLRQIENLQAAHSTQSVNWDKVEANLTQRLGKKQLYTRMCPVARVTKGWALLSLTVHWYVIVFTDLE